MLRLSVSTGEAEGVESKIQNEGLERCRMMSAGHLRREYLPDD